MMYTYYTNKLESFLKNRWFDYSFSGSQNKPNRSSGFGFYRFVENDNYSSSNYKIIGSSSIGGYRFPIPYSRSKEL